MCPRRGRRGWWQRCTLKIIKTLVIKSDFLLRKENEMLSLRRSAMEISLFRRRWVAWVGGMGGSDGTRLIVAYIIAKLVIFSRINKKTRGNLATKPLPCAATDNKFTEIVFCSRFSSSLTQFETEKHLNAKFVLLLTCPSSLKCESDDEARRKRITCRCFFGNINKHSKAIL